MGMVGQRHAPAALRPGKTRYPLYRRLGGPQGRSGRLPTKQKKTTEKPNKSLEADIVTVSPLMAFQNSAAQHRKHSVSVSVNKHFMHLRRS